MTHIAYTRCDHDDCWDTQTTDRIGWRVVDGEDYCPRHDPCATCGHQRYQHYGNYPPVVGCDEGYILDNTYKAPGRRWPDGEPLQGDPELWFGETFVVTPGCGCPTFAEPA